MSNTRELFERSLPVFVGFDNREGRAYEVCRWSLYRHSSGPLHVQPLLREALRHRGLYQRRHVTTRVDGFVRCVDEQDGEPFSTAFAFTRFLIPWLAPQGAKRAVFCDCDFLFTHDVMDLMSWCRDDSKALWCVKRNGQPGFGLKMDGQPQAEYPRKNWSSLMVWNLEHEANRRLTLEDVNTRSGRWLHNFSWLGEDNDHLIGPLPKTWNCLVGIDDVPDGGLFMNVTARAYHFTLGGPWFANYQDTGSKPERLWREYEDVAASMSFPVRSWT